MLTMALQYPSVIGLFVNFIPAVGEISNIPERTVRLVALYCEVEAM